VKSVVAICLAVAQCLSWGTPALYLCICRDGQICVDAGPQDCRCALERVAEQADACSGHEQSDDQGRCPCGDPCSNACGDRLPTSSTVAVSLVGCDPCDCTHIQLSWSQPPSLSTGLNPVDFCGALAHDALCLSNESHALIGAGIFDECPLPRQSHAVDWSCQVNRANLRC
jgi:hypothetical protein